MILKKDLIIKHQIKLIITNNPFIPRWLVNHQPAMVHSVHWLDKTSVTSEARRGRSKTQEDDSSLGPWDPWDRSKVLPRSGQVLVFEAKDKINIT